MAIALTSATAAADPIIDPVLENAKLEDASLTEVKAIAPKNS